MFACRVCCYNAFNSDELDGIFYINSDEYLATKFNLDGIS